MAGAARAGHAIGVADRDRATVDVQQFIRNAELVAAIKHLHGEGFVQFPDADIVHLQAKTLQQFRNCVNRADAHFVGLGSGDGHADIAPQRIEALLFGNLGFHQHAGRRAVGQLAGVTGGDGHVGTKHRLERLQSGQLGVGAVAFVLGDGDFLLGDFAGFLVGHIHGGGDGHDFGVEITGSLRSGGALLRLEGIFVHRVAADIIALGNHFGGLQHWHVDIRVHRDQVAVGGNAHFLGLYEADRILATGGHDVDIVDDDLLGGSSDGHQARRALAVHGHAGCCDRQAGAQNDLTCDVARLCALLKR